MEEKERSTQERQRQSVGQAVRGQKPMTEHFKKINKDAAIGIMRHKDGRVEKRKL